MEHTFEHTNRAPPCTKSNEGSLHAKKAEVMHPHPPGRRRCIMEGNAKMYQNLFMNSLDSGPESRYLIPSADFC